MDISENTKKLNDGTKLLKEIEKMAIDTENIGNNTLLQLKSQRVTITKINATTNDTSNEMDEARKQLRNMEKENLKSKATLLGVGAIITTLFGYVTFKTFTH